jgi:hypothetical protein
MSRLTKAFLDCERKLEELRYEPGFEARAHRVMINNAMADTLYAAAEKLKEEGDTEGYWFAHDAANKHWSAVCEELPNSKEELAKALANLPDHIKRRLT